MAECREAPWWRQPCSWCGDPVDIRRRPGRKPQCISCGTARLEANCRQIARKSGPFYERWALGMIRHGDRLRVQMQREGDRVIARLDDEMEASV